MIKNETMKNIRAVLERYEKEVLFGYLFGSEARCETSPLSDIDIAVFLEKQPERSFFEVKLPLYTDLCRALKRSDLDLVILNEASNLIQLDEIVRTGVVVYDRNPEARVDFELKTLHRSLDFKSHRFSAMGV